MDPIIVTYHDVTLHSSDVKLLDDSNWINDNLISFYYEHLTFEVFKDKKEEIAFVHPSTMFMLSKAHKDEAELREAVKQLKLESKQLVFMPINDNSSIERAGGSHWSLLTYNRSSNSFHYYDSYGKHNLTCAENTFKKVASILGATEASFSVETTPQQKNGYDCGLYVVAVSECLAHMYCGKEQSLQSITPESITAMRKSIKEKILTLQMQKQGMTSLFSLKKKK